jgi:hypothetical protein
MLLYFYSNFIFMDSEYSDLESSIRDLVLENIQGTDVGFLDFFARRNKRVLNPLYKAGLFDEKDLEKALELAVFRKADQYLSILKKGIEYPDHISSPEILAYAIEHNHFKKGDMQSINFDHGDNASSFCRKYKKDDLLSYLSKKLLEPKQKK